MHDGYRQLQVTPLAKLFFQVTLQLTSCPMVVSIAKLLRVDGPTLLYLHIFALDAFMIGDFPIFHLEVPPKFYFQEIKGWSSWLAPMSLKIHPSRWDAFPASVSFLLSLFVCQ